MLYVINELDATITALPYAADSGKLGEPVATVSTVPDDFPDAKSTAEIMVHPSGKFLYGSNRRFADHPDAEELGFLYGTILSGPPEDASHTTRNVCIFANAEVDRSPTGTGVSGHVALLAARGELREGEEITVESILGAQSVFCAWTKDDSHINYGEGPQPTVEKFTEFLSARVAAMAAR